MQNGNETKPHEAASDAQAASPDDRSERGAPWAGVAMLAALLLWRARRRGAA